MTVHKPKKKMKTLLKIIVKSNYFRTFIKSLLSDYHKFIITDIAPRGKPGDTIKAVEVLNSVTSDLLDHFIDHKIKI